MKKDTFAIIAGIIAFLVGYFTNPDSVTVFSTETVKVILTALQIGGGVLAAFGGGSKVVDAAKRSNTPS